jgi:hypothetical protein
VGGNERTLYKAGKRKERNHAMSLLLLFEKRKTERCVSLDAVLIKNFFPSNGENNNIDHPHCKVFSNNTISTSIVVKLKVIHTNRFIFHLRGRKKMPTNKRQKVSGFSSVQ